MTAVPCSSSPCGNKTTDPSGKCHVHRNGSSSGQVPTFHESLSATPSPSASEYADDAGRSREMVRVHHSAKESAQGIKGASVSRTTTNNGMYETKIGRASCREKGKNERDTRAQNKKTE